MGLLIDFEEGQNSLHFTGMLPLKRSIATPIPHPQSGSHKRKRRGRKTRTSIVYNFEVLMLPDSQGGSVDPIIRLDAEIDRN